MVIDLRDKVGEIAGSSPEAAAAAGAPVGAEDLFDDALSALINLGYQKNAAEKAINQVLKEGSDLNVQKLLRKALQRLAK